MRFSKKGSMQMSIEVIIIMVIAFVLLGLGIVFVKGLFTKLTGTTDQTMSQVGSPCTTANGDKPIVPDSFKITQGESAQKDICVFNNADKKLTAGLITTTSCIDPDGTTIDSTKIKDYLQIINGPLDIDRNIAKTYKTTVKSSTSAKIGTYICSIIVQKGTGYNKDKDPTVGPIQVTIEVQ